MCFRSLFFLNMTNFLTKIIALGKYKITTTTIQIKSVKVFATIILI